MRANFGSAMLQEANFFAGWRRHNFIEKWHLGFTELQEANFFAGWRRHIYFEK